MEKLEKRKEETLERERKRGRVTANVGENVAGAKLFL